MCDDLQPEKIATANAKVLSRKDRNFYKMLYWINWIVLLSLEPLAGELEYASVEWSAAGAWVGRVSP
jgi:hypothetical protein